MGSIICVSTDSITLIITDMPLLCTCSVLTDAPLDIKPAELKKTPGKIKLDRCAQNGLFVGCV